MRTPDEITAELRARAAAWGIADGEVVSNAGFFDPPPADFRLSVPVLPGDAAEGDMAYWVPAADGGWTITLMRAQFAALFGPDPRDPPDTPFVVPAG